MKKAGLLTPTRRGFYRITEAGQKLLKSKPSRIDRHVLRQFPAFPDFLKLKGTRKSASREEDTDNDIPSSATPSEALDNAYQSLRSQLASEILDQLKGLDPSHFE